MGNIRNSLIDVVKEESQPVISSVHRTKNHHVMCVCVKRPSANVPIVRQHRDTRRASTSIQSTATWQRRPEMQLVQAPGRNMAAMIAIDDGFSD